MGGTYPITKLSARALSLLGFNGLGHVAAEEMPPLAFEKASGPMQVVSVDDDQSLEPCVEFEANVIAKARNVVEIVVEKVQDEAKGLWIRVLIEQLDLAAVGKLNGMLALPAVEKDFEDGRFAFQDLGGHANPYVASRDELLKGGIRTFWGGVEVAAAFRDSDDLCVLESVCSSEALALVQNSIAIEDQDDVAVLVDIINKEWVWVERGHCHAVNCSATSMVTGLSLSLSC